MKAKYFRNTATTYHQLEGGPLSKPVSLVLRLGGGGGGGGVCNTLCVRTRIKLISLAGYNPS